MLVDDAQVAQIVTQLSVTRITWGLDQVPIQALCEVPLMPLAKLSSHKEQLFTWMSPHIPVKSA